MPVEFLTDDQAAAYGRYNRPPARAQLERFFLDDTGKVLVGKRRGDHNRLGFAVQLATVRYVGTFLADPVDAPSEVVDYVAEQLVIADPSCLKQYSQRETTHREHAGEIQRDYGLRDFPELSAWADARAWTTGEGPKATFDGAVAWLRERRVLLPGVSTLARLVARVQGEAA